MLIIRNKSIYYAILYIFIIFNLTLKDFYNTGDNAANIFYRDYWIKHKINQLPDELADIVFDNGIVQGQKTSIRHLQRALGVKADGIIGSDTLNAINYANYSTIKQEFINNVKSRIKAIVTKDPSQETFKNGWINRSNTY